MYCLYLAGVGIGLVFSALISATSRNPAIRPKYWGLLYLYAGKDGSFDVLMISYNRQ